MADLSKKQKEANDKKYILSEKEVQNLFAYLEELLDNSCCDHTLRYTEMWLKENISPKIFESVIKEIIDMGGYCDCEVLFNCYEDYDID